VLCGSAARCRLAGRAGRCSPVGWRWPSASSWSSTTARIPSATRCTASSPPAACSWRWAPDSTSNALPLRSDLFRRLRRRLQSAVVFDQSILSSALQEKEVEFTTYGRKSGKASRKIIWITNLDGRLYIRSGVGLIRDWPQNLAANQRGILHIAGVDVAVRARHVTDPVEAPALHAPGQAKDKARPPPPP